MLKNFASNTAISQPFKFQYRCCQYFHSASPDCGGHKERRRPSIFRLPKILYKFEVKNHETKANDRRCLRRLPVRFFA
ncbi:hypothetical protein, partial [Burkholderia sp. MSMB175]|uniref:hypothetical protein n=1 Tax=Burkholderia sp. MSMB175 TaxID=1086510 RepID=UPI001CA50C37